MIKTTGPGGIVTIWIFGFGRRSFWHQPSITTLNKQPQKNPNLKILSVYTDVNWEFFDEKKIRSTL